MRVGAPERNVLNTQGNLAITYEALGQKERALPMRRDVYFGYVKILGKQDYDSIREATNYADTLLNLERFKEARSLTRKMMPVARRVLGENDAITLNMRWSYARALYEDTSAALADLREAVTTLEEMERIVRRKFGSAHPLTKKIEVSLEEAQAALRSRETQPAEDLAEEVD